MSKTLKQHFNDAVDLLERDARENGFNFTQICQRLGVSRATPNRWRIKAPMTVELVTAMQLELKKMIEEKKNRN